MSTGRRSLMLVFALGLGAMFAILYISGLTAEPSSGHDYNIIPTEPRISQLEAIEITEQDLGSKVQELRETRLDVTYYNFSWQENEIHPEYYSERLSEIGDGWSFSHVKQYPEPLQLPLIFAHANGTVYSIDAANNSFEMMCLELSADCPEGGYAVIANDRLIYVADINWDAPPIARYPYNIARYVIDAETGEVAFNTTDYELCR